MTNILHLYSESGDHYYYQTKSKFSEDEVAQLIRENHPDDIDCWSGAGPGIAGSYFHYEYLDVEVVE